MAIESILKRDKIKAHVFVVDRFSFPVHRSRGFCGVKNPRRLGQFSGRLARARAVLCFAFNRREPIVDVNVMRIMNRFAGLTNEIEVRKILVRVLPSREFKKFNWGLLDLAQLICKANRPRCALCPLNAQCPKIKVDVSKWRILRKSVRHSRVKLTLQEYSRADSILQNMETYSAC